MRKVISMIMAIVLLAAFLSVGNTVYAQGKPYLEVSGGEGKPGDEVKVTISLKNSPGFGGLAYDMYYDNTLLEPVSYELNLGSDICVDSGLDIFDDHVNFQYVSTANVEGDGVLVTVWFRIIATKSCTIEIRAIPEEGTTFYYEGRSEVDFTLDDASGSITVNVANEECSHASKTKVPAKNADCVNPGNQSYYICGCGKIFKADGVTETTVENETIAAVGHVWADASCTDPKRCTVCGKTQGDKLSHNFANYISNNDAGCETDGTKTAKCSNCDATQTIADAGSATGHSWIDADCDTPRYCSICNKTQGEALGHRYSEVWCKSESSHWHECEACGVASDRNGHTIVNEKCEVCGYQKAHVHDLILVESKKATCTDDGNKEYYVCSGCEGWFSDAEASGVIADKRTVVIPALGHNWANASCDTPKTCIRCNNTKGEALGHNFATDWRKGENGHWNECVTCGVASDCADHTFADGECTACGFVEAHKHDLTLVAQKKATCTQNGNQAYYTCNGCENWFADDAGLVLIADKRSVAIAATGHNWSAATCEKAKTCRTCKETVGSALGHNYASGWSKGENGHWRECDRCGDATDRAGHAFDNGGCTVCGYGEVHEHSLVRVAFCEATCTGTGNQEYYICNGCEDWFADMEGVDRIADKRSVIITAFGHELIDATCEASRSCSKCGEAEGEALGHEFMNGVCIRCMTVEQTIPEDNTEQEPEASNWFVRWIGKILKLLQEFLESWF